MRPFRLLCAMVFLPVVFGVVSAATLDTAKATLKWSGYKFYDKTAVGGTFKGVKYEWQKGKDIAGVLQGAKATIDTLSVDLGDEGKNENLREGFFKAFKDTSIVATIDKVTPDSKDKNKGRLELNMQINGVTKPVWMPYTISKGKFVATGVIDFYDFELTSAFDKLKETCGVVHEGKTWPEASFSLEVPVKK